MPSLDQTQAAGIGGIVHPFERNGGALAGLLPLLRSGRLQPLGTVQAAPRMNPSLSTYTGLHRGPSIFTLFFP